MGELIFFVVASVESDEDAEIMDSRCDFDGCPCEFGGELIEAVGGDLLRRAGDPERGDWRVMRSLLGNI